MTCIVCGQMVLPGFEEAAFHAGRIRCGWNASRYPVSKVTIGGYWVNVIKCSEHPHETHADPPRQ